MMQRINRLKDWLENIMNFCSFKILLLLPIILLYEPISFARGITSASRKITASDQVFSSDAASNFNSLFELGDHHRSQDLLGEKTNPLSPTTSSDNCSQKLCISIKSDGDDGKVSIEPKSLKHIATGDVIPFYIDPNLRSKIKVFLRDPEAVAWNFSQNLLSAKKAGRTEVFIIYKDTLHILPVFVDATPKASVSFQADPWKSLKAQTDSIMSTYLSNQSAFQIESFDLVKKNGKLIIQLLDERSIIDQEKLYPLKDLRVSVVGRSGQRVSDVRGMLSFENVPAFSRFFIRIDDLQGRVPPHYFTIQTDSLAKPQVERLKIMGYRTWFLYSRVFQVSQNAALSSFCMKVQNKDGSLTYPGLSATMNLESNGPYYFNDLGPAPEASSTGSNGRFCFFNVKPGLAEIKLFDEESKQFISAISVPILKQAHLEETWKIADVEAFELQLAALPSATQQLYQDYDEWFEFDDIDFIDLITIGENESLPSLESGVLFGASGFSSYKDRLYSLSQAAEFEPVLYNLNISQINQTRGRPVIPLFSRGFFEDLFFELNLIDGMPSIAFDQALGTVLSFHAIDSNLNSDLDSGKSLNVRLVDSLGIDIDTGWIFGSGHDGYFKTVFFNLQPGNYTVIIENEKGEWIDSSTVVVDFWTNSFVQTGGFLTKQLRIYQ